MNNFALSPAESALQERLAAVLKRIPELETDKRITAEMRPSLAWHFARARQVVEGLQVQFGTFSPRELETVERLIAEAESCAKTGATVIGVDY